MKISSFRLKAFLTHLLLSLLIALISLYVVFFIWHPVPLAKAVGVTSIFLMMVAIDAILGPLLTLIVAKKGKKTLKLDLLVIILLQMGAFVYGIYNIASSRPVYIAYDGSRFDLVQANNLAEDSLDSADAPFNKPNWGKPKMVAVKEAKDDKELNNRIFSELETGISPSMQAELYEPLDRQWNRIAKNGKPLTELSQYNNQDVADEILSKYPSANMWLPLRSYDTDMVVLVDKTGQPLDIIDLRPWKL